MRLGSCPVPCRRHSLEIWVPFPTLKPQSESRDCSSYSLRSSPSSSAAGPPPAVPADREPGTFAQESPLDPLPGELTTFRGLSGEYSGAEDSRVKGLFLERPGSGRSSPRFRSGGPGLCALGPHPALPRLPPTFVLLQPPFDLCS